MSTSTDAKIRVRIGGQETEITPQELAEKYSALEGAHSTLQEQAGQLARGYSAVQQSAEALRLIREDPGQAIKWIYDEAKRKGLQVELPDSGAPRQTKESIDDDGYYYDDETDPEGDDMSGQPNQELLQLIADLKGEVETLKLRGSLIDGIETNAKSTGIDKDAIRAYMLENGIADPAIAAKLIQADKLLAAQAATDEATSQSSAEDVAKRQRQAEIEALMNGREGLSPMHLPDEMTKVHVREDGTLDQEALIKSALAVNGISL